MDLDWEAEQVVQEEAVEDQEDWEGWSADSPAVWDWEEAVAVVVDREEDWVRVWADREADLDLAAEVQAEEEADRVED